MSLGYRDALPLGLKGCLSLGSQGCPTLGLKGCSISGQQRCLELISSLVCFEFISNGLICRINLFMWLFYQFTANYHELGINLFPMLIPKSSVDIVCFKSI